MSASMRIVRGAGPGVWSLRFWWRPFVALVMVITALLALPAVRAEADPSTTARAVNLVDLSYHSFMAAKALAAVPFDWRDDGCSGPTWDAALLFSPDPCRQHDFGYRNFGGGLGLGRDEAHRRWIDDRLKSELQRSCNERYSGWSAWIGPPCRQAANSFHIAVRNWGRSAFYP